MQPASNLILPGTVTPDLLTPGFNAALSVDGQNEAVAPVYNVAGVLPTSILHYVEVYTTKAAIATVDIRQGSDYTSGNGTFTVTGGAVDNTNNQCVFHWTV